MRTGPAAHAGLGTLYNAQGMDQSSVSAASAAASAVAAIASAFTSIWLAKMARRTLHVQIEPSISIDFDHDASGKRRKIAYVINDGACDLKDVYLQVSIPDAFEEKDGTMTPMIFKSVGNHDLQLWIIPRLWHRNFKSGVRVEVDSDSWFTHAREVLALTSLPEEQRAMRGFVILDRDVSAGGGQP